MTDMMQKAAKYSDEICELLAGLRAKVDTLDPEGAMTDLRIFLAYSLRLAENPSLLAREATNMEQVRDKIAQVAQFTEHVAYRATPKAAPKPDAEWMAYTAKLYGEAWAVFDRDRFLANSDLFKRRFVANGIDLAMFEGTSCLDFGCGTGRNCLAMARLGASKVTGVDLSEGNIKNARGYLENYPEFSKIELVNANVYEHFSGKQGLFDFVVAQGVLQTMPSPDEALSLIHRVLKPGAKAFIYFFGESEKGILWDVAKTWRHLLKPVPMEVTKSALLMLNANQGDIFNLLDFAYVPHQHHWPREKFEASIKKAGFTGVTPLLRGETYDGHQRILDYPWEKNFWGDFDLRYWLTK